MNNNNESKLISLTEIFKNRFFIVPDYQRGYSWSSEQLKDLKSDIDKILNNNYKHFTGTLVASKSDEHKFSIVDGQQRLTTLVILISAAISSKKINKEFASSLKQTFIVRGELGNEKPVLTTNNETNIFFNQLVIRNETPKKELKSHHRIEYAKNFFEEWFSNEDIDVQSIVEAVTNKLGFLLFTPDDSKEIGIMFEVINNRGKPLSQLEKLKNYLIYYASVNGLESLRSQVDEDWQFILKSLSVAGIHSSEDENRFLRNCFLVFANVAKKDSWNIYDQVKIRFPEKGNHTVELDRLLKFIKQCAANYEKIYTDDTALISQQREVLKSIRCLPTKASIMPLVLSVMSKLCNDKGLDSKVYRLLSILEILNFRVYILPKVTARADSHQTQLFQWAFELFEDKLSIEELEELLISFTQEHCSERKFIQSLTIDQDESEDYGNWVGLRYFLGNYEKYIADNENYSFDLDRILLSIKDDHVQSNDFLSIEHIWARRNKEKDFPINFIEKRRLGNLVLMGLRNNIKKTNLGISEKVQKITDTSERMDQVNELKKIYNSALKSDILKDRKKYKNYFRDLSKIINDERETRLVKFALKRWKFETEEFEKFVRVDSFKTEKFNESFVLKSLT